MAAQGTSGIQPNPTSWLGILDALYADAWNPRLRRFRSRFAYRGVGIATGTLETSLARIAGETDDLVRLELGLLRSFRKYAGPDACSGDTIWHWLALGQHAGLPTRLLDWTYSPLVALHFATANRDHIDRDGEVWCVDFGRVNQLLPRRLRRLLANEQSETFTVEMLREFSTLQAFDRTSPSPFVMFVEPPTLHMRLAGQHALFSLMPGPGARLERWLERQPNVYRRIPVPAALKPEIRDKLDQANITERILQGGLDGLACWLARYYRPTPAPRVTPARTAAANVEASNRGPALTRPERADRRRSQTSERRSRRQQR